MCLFIEDFNKNTAVQPALGVAKLGCISLTSFFTFFSLFLIYVVVVSCLQYVSWSFYNEPDAFKSSLGASYASLAVMTIGFKDFLGETIFRKWSARVDVEISRMKQELAAYEENP